MTSTASASSLALMGTRRAGMTRTGRVRRRRGRASSRGRGVATSAPLIRFGVMPVPPSAAWSRPRLAQETAGAAVRELRLARGWTQPELARRVKLHRSYVGGVERGERNLTVRNLLRFAAALGVQPADLLPTFRTRAR